jgi:hypothetical protein
MINNFLFINIKNFINLENPVIAVLFLILKIGTKSAITIIALLAAVVLFFNAENIQPIGSELAIFSELSSVSYSTICSHYITCGSEEFFPSLILLSYVVPVKPAVEEPKRFTKAERAEFKLTKEQSEIAVGLILGDLHIKKGKNSVNACLEFAQSIIHKSYLELLYDQFKELCSKGPTIRTKTLKERPGKVYGSIRFYTYSLPCFNALFELFYVEGTKIVPLTIGVLLTVISLAY